MRIHADEQILLPRVPDALSDDPRLAMKEAELQDAVIDLAVHLGFLVYHTHDSRRSAPGFPDLVLVNGPRQRTLYVELKRTGGTLTLDQTQWLGALADAGNHVHLWQPYEWITGSIERELRGPRI